MLVHNVCILLQITSNIISFKILINLCYRLNLFCYFSAYNYKKFARPKTPCSAFFKMTYFFHQDLFVTSVNNGSFNHNFSDLSGKLRKRPAKLQLMVHLYLFDDISSIYIYIHVMYNVYKPFHIRLHYSTPRCIWIFLIKITPIWGYISWEYTSDACMWQLILISSLW